MTTAFETGYAAADLRQHASRPTVNGPRALCGAGAIVQPVAGRFDTEVAEPCGGCVEALLPARRRLVTV